METKGHNVFAELGLSCFSIESYQTIRKNGFGKRLLYHLILAVLLFGITFGIPYVQFLQKTGGIQAYIEENVPDFQISSGGNLYMSRPFSVEENGTLIMIDSDAYFDYRKNTFYKQDSAGNWTELGTTKKYNSVMLMDYEKIMIYTQEDGFNEMTWEEMVDVIGTVNRQTLVDWCNSLIPLMAIILFIGVFIGILWDAFISSLILWVIARIQGGIVLPYMQLYTVSLYARTPFKLLLAICTVINVSIPYAGLLALIATAVYSAIITNSIKKDERTRPVVTRY